MLPLAVGEYGGRLCVAKLLPLIRITDRTNCKSQENRQYIMVIFFGYKVKKTLWSVFLRCSTNDEVYHMLRQSTLALGEGGLTVRKTFSKERS